MANTAGSSTGSSAESEALKISFDYLINGIDTAALLPKALGTHLVSEPQRSECASETDPYKKAEKFLGHLQRAVNGASNKYHIFMQILKETGQASIASRLCDELAKANIMMPPEEQLIVPSEELLEELVGLRISYASFLRGYKKILQGSADAQEEFVETVPGVIRRELGPDHSFQSYFNTLIDEEVSLFNIIYLKKLCDIFPHDVCTATKAVVDKYEKKRQHFMASTTVNQFKQLFPASATPSKLSQKMCTVKLKLLNEWGDCTVHDLTKLVGLFGVPGDNLHLSIVQHGCIAVLWLCSSFYIKELKVTIVNTTDELQTKGVMQVFIGEELLLGCPQSDQVVQAVPLGMDDSSYSQQGTPYLKVYGLPKIPEMSERDVKIVLISTFGNQLSSGDQGVLNVSMTSTSEAVVQFVDNNDCYKLADEEHDFLGEPISVELCYKDASLPVTYPQSAPYLRVSGVKVMSGMDTEKLLMSTILRQLLISDKDAVKVTLHADTGEAMVEFKNCDDCHNLAGRQLRFLGKLLTVELCYKTAEESFSADEPQLSKDDHIPYLKLSGLPEVPPGLDVAEALKQTFRNQLPKPDDLGNIEVELTGASEAVVEFENSQSCLYLAKLSHYLFGKQFVTELCYMHVASNKVLVICNLPDLDPGVIKQCMEVILRRKTKAVIDKFAMVENTAYITFCDSSGASDVMCDPLREFLGSPVDCSIVDKDEVDMFLDSIPRVLLMKGLPENVDSTLLKYFLQAQFKNAGHEVLDCVIDGTMAYIKFSDSIAVHKLVNSPPENSTFFGKIIEYHSILETEVPDFTPHVLLVRGLPRNQSVPSVLPIYLKNSCGVSPTAVDVSEGVARVTFEDGQAARKIVACPPTRPFLGCMLQFSAVKDTSVACETSEEHDSHLHVPLSSDMVMVEGLPDYATENSLCKALEKKGLPLPASLHVDDEEQVAYLQFDNTEVVPTVIRSLSSSQLLGKYVDPKAMSSNDLPSISPKETLHLLSPKSKGGQTPASRKRSPSLPAKFIHTGRMPFKGEEVAEEDNEEDDAGLSMKTILRKNREPSGVYSRSVVVRKLPTDTKVESYVLGVYMCIIAGIESSNVKIGGPLAVVEFPEPVDVKDMRQKALSKPFPVGHKIVHIEPLEESRQVLVTGFPSDQDYAVKMYLHRYQDSIENIEKKSEDALIVTFKNYRDVESVVSKDHKVGGNFILSFSAYHSVLDELEQYKEPPPPPPQPEYTWGIMKRPLAPVQKNFYEYCISSFLGEQLQAVHAKISIEAKELKIEPLEGASQLQNWEDQVNNLLDDCLSDFTTAEQELNQDAVTKVWMRLETFKSEHTDLHYVPRVDSSTIKVAGSKKSVNAALQLISEVTETELEMNKTFKLPPKHVKYLLKFHRREIEAIKPSVKIVEESARVSQLVVTGVKRSLDSLDTLVSEKLQLAHEEVLPLSTTAHKLLTSRRGTGKLTEIASGLIPEVIHVVEKIDDPGGQLTLVSQNRSIVNSSIKYVKNLIVERKIFLTPEKQRICTGDNLEWRSFVETHTNEHFLAIKVIGEEVVVVGEALTVPDIVKKVEKLLSEQTAVTTVFELPRAKWQVLRRNLFEKIEAVQKDRPSVQWILPKSDVTQAKMVSIFLRGDPVIVEHVKRSLELITNEVRTKEITLPPQTGLKQVVESMEFKCKCHEFQEKYKAVVEIELNEPVKLATPFKVRGQSGTKLLVKATTPAGVRVKVMTGDFAREQTDILVNFVTESPNFHSPVLSALVKVGGSEVQQDLQSKNKLLVGTAHVCSRGRLSCSSLVHVVVPTYTTNPRIFETVLSEALPQVIQVTSDCRRMVITPLTAAPFHCPVQVYADRVLGALGTMFDYNTDVSDVFVFVENASCKDIFEETMKSNNYHIFPPVVDYRVANSSHSSTVDLNVSLQRSVTIKKGSILDVQADVYVNSTNPELDMSKGELPQVFLKACGDKLQEEAKHYSPLAFGQVAVTSAKNLKAKSIYHISLPDYKSPQSEKKYRETIRTILHTAQGEGVSSIAIPPLGVANLNYPAKLAAEILFDEVVTFHTQNRSAIQSFVFVIYRDEDYKIFKQEYETHVSKAASLACRSQLPKDILQVNIVNGDLADEKSDVVVNSTSANMVLTVNHISQAISKKAGPRMQAICSSFVQAGMSLEDATIIPTPASGSLKCRKVYHAYVEKKKAGTPPTPKQTNLIQKVVQNCLCKAEEEKMTSISFPIFCLGAEGYTVIESCSPMLEAVKKFTQKSPKYLEKIRIVVLDDKMFRDFKELFLKFFPTGVQTQPQRGRNWSPKQLFQYMPKEEGVSIAITPQKSMPPEPCERHYHYQVQDCGATVCIYCTEPNAINKVEKSLKLHFAENIVTASVDLGELATLLGDDDARELYDIGNQSGVAVKLQRTMERLLIDGEVTAVGKACHLIHRKVLKFLEITGELKVYEWVSTDDSGTSVPYSSEICFQLENAYKNNVPSVDAVINDVHLVINLRDHSSITETDRSSGVKRVVKRTRRPFSALPSNWTPQPNDDNGKPKVCAYIEVAEGTPEYDEATHHFKQTLGLYNVTIAKVQRVQNPGEYMRYEAIKACWHQTTEGNVKEETVFHGTKRANIEPISKTGFNRIFAAEANAAYFGSGVYFARNSSYSVQDKYSAPEPNGKKNILVCSLLVSQFTKGTKNIKIAPNIPGKEVLYDTLVDDTDNPTIFVAMKDFQAYPNYWIQFRVNRMESSYSYTVE